MGKTLETPFMVLTRQFQQRLLAEYLEDGKSLSEISRELGVSRPTIYKILNLKRGKHHVKQTTSY